MGWNRNDRLRKIKMIYDKLSQYYDQFLDLELYDEYYNLIKKYIKKGNVIDLGTGTGILAIRLAKEDFFVTATDISTRMLETAYNNALIEKVEMRFYIHDVLESLNKPYDLLIMSSDVINYMENESDVLKVFKNISEAMNKKSIFIFDFLRPEFLESLHNYTEDIDLGDEEGGDIDLGDEELDVDVETEDGGIEDDLDMDLDTGSEELLCFGYQVVALKK